MMNKHEALMPKYNEEELWPRILAWCDRRERSEAQAAEKLRAWNISEALIQSTLKRLKDCSAVDDSRFAEAYVSDAFRFRNWGKRRMEMQLKSYGIEQKLIGQALESINPNEYRQKLLEQIRQETRRKHSIEDYPSRMKLAATLARRGFDSDLIFSCIEEMNQG
jgi:regulatory protein